MTTPISLRRLASSLLLAAVAALPAAACAVDEPAPADCRAPIDLWLQATEIAGVDGPVVELSIPGDVPVILDGGVCACATAECRDAYVEEQLGCGVCVTFDCDGHKVGGCAACGADSLKQPPSPSPFTIAPAPAPPVELGGLGELCGEDLTCDAGLTCLTGGLAPHKQRSTCEIACPLGDKQCPAGTACTTIFDGPGRVCRPTFWW